MGGVPGAGKGTASYVRMPELTVALFSLLLHFVWEMLQVPLFSGVAEMSHWDGVRFCLSATVGDVGIALGAFWTTALVAGSRQWLLRPSAYDVTVFILAGLIATVALEYYHTNISLRWSYSELMPLVPPLGTGLSPLLQWIVVPMLVVWLASRHLRGHGCEHDGGTS